MSQFTVINGGGRGPPDRHSDAARYHLEQAIIEILRSLVRGYDAEQRVSHHLTEFFRHLPETSTSLEVIIADALGELHRDLDHGIERDVFEGERESIVLAALQVAAEAMASDPAAKGRLSGRQSRLEAAIEHRRVSREARAAKWQKEAPKTPAERKAALDKTLASLKRLKGEGRKPRNPKGSR